MNIELFKEMAGKANGKSLIDACLEEITCLRQQLAAAKETDLLLRNLLCVIHRDGGHHITAHGLDQSVQDAMEVFYNLRDLPEQLAAALAACEVKDAALQEVVDLIGESSGVYGLHLNGDNAPWEEVEQGGRFERLTSLCEALAVKQDATALNAHDEALIERCIVTVESESLGDVEGDYSVAVKHCANALRELKSQL